MNASCHHDLRTGLDRPQRAGEGATVHLGAFGKHPAWNDHIDDFGLETDMLVEVKRMIYVDGISSQIDSGAWERLSADAIFPHFDHGFVWQRNNEAVLGVLSDSRDGKGRARYPIALCLHAVGVPMSRLAADFLPVLERALVDCRQWTSVAQVTGTLARARASLQAAVRRGAGPLGSVPVSSATPGVGAQDEGLIRILYQIRSQFGAWAPVALPRAESVEAARTAHVRVPLGGGCLDWLTWMRFLRSQLAAEAPLLLMWPRAGRWLDMVAGTPTAADFFALKANARTIPPASEVPYRVDPAFNAAALTCCRQADANGVPLRSIFEVTRNRGSFVSDASRIYRTHGRSWARYKKLSIAAVTAALVAVLVYCMISYGDRPPWLER